MTPAAIADDATRRKEVEAARLDLIADNFRHARWQVALWTTIALVASSGAFRATAPGISPALIAWAAYHYVVAFGFHLALRGWDRGAATGWFGIRRSTAYSVLYLMSGTAWGLYAWANLRPGVVQSEAATAIVLVAVSAIYCARVSAHPRVFLAATLSASLIALPRFLTTGDELGILFGTCGLLWIAMIVPSALKQSARIAEMIETKLQNETLATRFAAARDEAQAASRAKSAFLANMSHELRTPLNAIIGFSDIMQRGMFGGLGERYQGYAEDINQSGADLLTLINDLLDIAKIEAGRMQVAAQPIDPAEELENVVGQLRRKADAKAQTIRLMIAPALGEILADARAFRQIALNLAGNAVKFTQDGGAIDIAMMAEGRDAVLTIADDGPGIPDDRLNRIFAGFERVGPAYSDAKGGPGLGLALVKALVDLHGGHATIDSRLGDGTTVTVRFPNAIGAPALRQAA